MEARPIWKIQRRIGSLKAFGTRSVNLHFRAPKEACKNAFRTIEYVAKAKGFAQRQ